MMIEKTEDPPSGSSKNVENLIGSIWTRLKAEDPLSGSLFEHA